MAKLIHTMIRVIDESASVAFYQQALGLSVKDRFEFETFVLVYLRNEENDVELELTINKDQQTPYTHGTGYGHIAVAVNNIEQEHQRMHELGLSPEDIVSFDRDGCLMAKFFFLQDPDGYQIEVLQHHGRYK